jgi:hypothetical protein
MTLDEIFAEWSKDCVIDKMELDNQSIETPKLHSKYLKFYAIERMTLQKLEQDYKILFKLKNEYFGGTLDMDTIKEQGWEPNSKMILRSDIGMHIDADPDIQKLTLRIGLQKEKISTLDSILKTIANRGFQIKNAIDFQRMMNGI